MSEPTTAVFLTREELHLLEHSLIRAINLEKSTRESNRECWPVLLDKLREAINKP